MEPMIVFGVIIAATIVIYSYTTRNNRPAPPPRPWYELPGDQIAIRPYNSPELATTEANLAAGFGWSVQSVATNDGHVNVGRVLLTGGLSVVTGGARTKGQVFVTYTRVVAVPV